MCCFIVLIVIFMNHSGLPALLSHYFIVTIPRFVRQILRENVWIPDKKYFMQPWSRHPSNIRILLCTANAFKKHDYYCLRNFVYFWPCARPWLINPWLIVLEGMTIVWRAMLPRQMSPWQLLKVQNSRTIPPENSSQICFCNIWDCIFLVP